MDKVYNFQLFESYIQELWQTNNAFSPKVATEQSLHVKKASSHKTATEPLSDKHTFVVVIPPPNVTGVLHMGHALNNNIQDILVRYYRMQGRTTLWVPGSDHAGIATQQVVERQLAKEQKTRFDLGREKFVERTWKLALDHKKSIIAQLHRLGASCDWNYERFTLDEGLSDAVKEVFVTLYEKGLIYRGDYLVNWSVDAGTALSDEEVIYKEVKGKLYHIRYKLSEAVEKTSKETTTPDCKDSVHSIIVATTRPETMFGDTAVAVHPDDARYKKFIGKTLHLPLTNKHIKIIADTYVDPSFGSGAVKITPAHDYNDYEVSKRHNLEIVNILNTNGTLNAKVPTDYQGLKVKDARKLVVQHLEEQGYLVKSDDYVHSVGHCYRTDCVVEPLFSRQWFVRMDSMAKKALQALADKKICFYPKRWENTYTHWLSNIKDWCISRQLWWGHRIPVWYDNSTGEMIVSRTDPSLDPKYKGLTLKQDEDVLDTWFSSWLWPFTVFGWPHQTQDLAQFYPTTTLVTAYDIIFFWVSRMIMAGLEFTGKVPFRDIYIHGLIRDEKGRKMSKSLGNGIDPIEIIDQYGSDALRFTLSYMCKLGGDILLNKDNFQLGSKFANKIWNASRFLLLNLENIEYCDISELSLNYTDKWILSRLQITVQAIEDAMNNYRLDDVAHFAYDYFWTDFCDWYVEISKTSLYSDNLQEKERASQVLLWVLIENLKLLHPLLPFITEEIYQNIVKLVGLKANTKPVAGDVLSKNSTSILATLPYPQKNKGYHFSLEHDMFLHLQEIVTGIRTLRSEFNLSPKLKLKIAIFFANQSEILAYFQSQLACIKNLVGAEDISLVSRPVQSSDAGIGVEGKNCTAMVDIKDIIDIKKELERLQAKLSKTSAQKQQLDARLANKAFIENAKPEYIAEIQVQHTELTHTIAQLESFIARLA